MFAQVVFNLPVQGPFDYLIPPHQEQDLKTGMRVEVSFGRHCCLGYVVGKVKQTQAKKIKPILRIIDNVPVLDKAMLKLTQQVAGYYACSWGEAIETALPVSLRKGEKIELSVLSARYRTEREKEQILLLQDIKAQRRWEIYSQEIKDSLNVQGGVIFLTPDKDSAALVQQEIKKRLNVEVGLFHSYLPERKELEQWLEVKTGRLKVVVGTRLAIFTPSISLGLIIIEEEQSPFYKQDSVPHYNAVGVAQLRAKIELAKLILSSRSPTLETWYQAKKGRIKYILKDTEIPVQQIKIVDLRRVGFIPQRRRIGLSISLEDAINRTLNQNGRVVLFLNRRGFAIFASCQNCKKVLCCPRCNANLVLHFKNSQLTCHRCNYKVQSPRICPNCNSAYIQYSGLGTEKLESELSRLYPQIKIARLDKENEVISGDAQIIVSTEAILRQPYIYIGPQSQRESTSGITDLGLIGVISLDSALNQPDFRAAEKVFALLLHLACLTPHSLIIQTNFPDHYCFQALSEKKVDLFYEKELDFRRQADLPPFNHIIVVKLRGRKEERVSCAAEELFNLLKNSKQNKSIKIVSHSARIPHKERDKFYEQVLIKTKAVPKTVNFLKKNLNKFHRSGIIITVNVDPL